MKQIIITQQITIRETESLGKYFNEISAKKMITAEEERELAKKAISGDLESINKLVEANLRFVVSVAKQYQSSGEILDDLISAGNIGLIEAAKRFDESRGFKFISYAVWWIRQSITQYISETNNNIRLPLNKIGALYKIKTIKSDLEQKLQRNPTSEEISINLTEKYGTSMSEDSVNHLLSLANNMSSLDAHLSSNNESGTLNDIVEGEGLEEINRNINISDLKIRIRNVVKKLTPREQEVITLFFGLKGAELSLEQIGKKLDLSAERVRQIKDKTLRRMRSPSNKRILNEMF